MFIRSLCLFSLLFSSLNALVIPIVTVEENGRLEELADETGANEWRFMKNAGLSVSVEAEKMIDFNKLRTITVLMGKGYNGGNALWAGVLLKKKGYNVEVYRLFPANESPLISQQIMEMFEKEGGIIKPFTLRANDDADLIIDGILGASFQGAAEGIFADAINWANECNRPILSVDIPSGLNGDTGEVKGAGIRATHTVTFFFPRVGFFVRGGWNYVGTLSIVNLGIEGKILSLINPEAYLMPNEESTKYLEADQIFKLDRERLGELIGSKPECTFAESQAFSNENQLLMLFTDHPPMLITPLEKPILFGDIHLYKVSESGHISESFDFLEK